MLVRITIIILYYIIIITMHCIAEEVYVYVSGSRRDNIVRYYAAAYKISVPSFVTLLCAISCHVWIHPTYTRVVAYDIIEITFSKGDSSYRHLCTGEKITVNLSSAKMIIGRKKRYIHYYIFIHIIVPIRHVLGGG